MKETKTAIRKVCEAIEDKKGDALTLLDVSAISSFTNFFVICQGQSNKQNQAICDGIRERLRNELNQSPSHVEGYQRAEWILMDYLDFVVHIFAPETRRTYNLENLWSDGVELQPKTSIS